MTESDKVWRVELGKRPPLNLNDRDHWTAKSKKTRAVRRIVKAKVLAQGLPTGLGHISTQLVWMTPDARRRDEDNLVATAKAAWDGLVDAGIVEDDTPQFMTKLMPRIVSHPTRGESRCDLWVWRAPRVRSVPEMIIDDWRD